MHIIEKSTLEIIPEAISFKNNLASGESVISHSVTCTDTGTGVDKTAEIILADSFNSTSIILSLQDGVNYAKYLINGIAITSFGNTYTGAFILSIVDPAPDYYTKFVDDNFVIAVDYSWDVDTASGESISSVAYSAIDAEGSDVSGTIITEMGFIPAEVFLRVAAGERETLYIIGVLATTSLGYKYYEVIHLRVADNA